MGIKVTKQSKIIVIILICLLLTMGVAVESFALFRSYDTVHVSSIDLQLRLIENIHGDKNIPIWQVRLFHNKFEGMLFDIFDAYVQFWTTTFLFRWIGLVGVVGVWLQWYYFCFHKRNKWLWSACALVLLFPFIEMFGLINLPFQIRAALLSLPFLVWALLGYRNFLTTSSRARHYIVFGILFASLWSTVALSLYYLYYVRY